MNKLRIRPVIDGFGTKYIIEKKGLFFWSIDKSSAGSTYRFGLNQCFYIEIIRYISVREARKSIEEQYGESAEIVEYKP